MIISLRLQGFLASAIVLSLGVNQSPTAVLGQSLDKTARPATNSFESDFGPARQLQSANGNLPSAETPLGNSVAAAQQALLKARQALAQGDVDTATMMLNTAKQLQVDFSAVGDTPETVSSMIQRQGQLANMVQAKDPAYNTGAASFLLIQAEALIQYRDLETAEMLIKQAQMFPVEFTPAVGSPEKLLALLASAKTQPSPKSETLKLLSQAQLAMDQERWNEAQTLVQHAKQLNVPESQFSTNETRPWQLELKIQNALNRQKFDPAVVPTSFENSTSSDTKTKPEPGNVIQANYDPNKDTTKNVQVGAVSDAAKSATADKAAADFNRLPNSGLEFYNAGLKALTLNDQAAAVAYFQKAWENRESMDGAARKAVKDQIERLVPGNDADNILKATLASQETDIDINQIKIDQRTAFSKLQSDLFKERAAAEGLLESKPREALEKMTMVRGRIAQSNLDPESQRPLLAIIDRDISEMQKYIEQNLPDIMNDEANAQALDDVERRRQHRQDVETQLQKLVNDYNKLIDEKRFAEAGVIVSQASDLAPDGELVVLLREKHRIQSSVEDAMAIKAMKQDGFLIALRNSDEASIAMDERTPLQFGDLEDYAKNRARRDKALEASRYSSESEARIYNLLKNEQVQGEYRGTLAEAVEQLARQANVNIVFDDYALTAEGIKKDLLVNVPILSPISLNSALEIILSQAGLVFVVESEVIKVTSKDANSANLKVETYYIGDLVMPMNQNPDPLRMNFSQPGMTPGVNRGSFNAMDNGTVQSGTTSQLALSQQINAPGNPFNGMNFGNGYGGNGPQTGTPTYAKVGGEHFGGVTLQDFTPLIQLISNTIQNESWLENGGVGTIQAFPANLSLIVSQTQEIQDQIQDLLKKLRELNDVQIVIEVRFLTLNDEFFEKIGIDFDFNINDNSGLTAAQAAGDRPGGGSRVVGRGQADGQTFTPTTDLDLKFLQGSFTAAQPIFGAAGLSPTTAGSFGFAILSDIEVFFLIQASKGDQRSSIMQAPTVTMFNGQSANVSDGASRPFVTSVVPVVGDFAVAHQPIITILPDGTTLDVQAVVSDDRRFVRLNLVPFFSQVTDVETFTFDGSTTTQRSTNSILDDLLDRIPGRNDTSDDELETVTQGITIQLPVLSFTTINTVVSVPDGGTVLMGGIKRMSEGRSEFGIPFLSSIPYVNRLFKNTAIGHTTSNLMMMVTPRIIIQKELEEDQMGLPNN